MKELTLLLGVLLSLGAGFVVYRKVKDIASQGLVVALVAIGSFLVAAGLVCRFLIPALTDAVRGFYGYSANNGMGLMVALGMFALAIIMSGSLLTSVSALEGWHKKGVWIAIGFIGFVYGKALFQNELIGWWRDNVLPSNASWAFSLRLGWDIPVAAAVLVLVFAGAKFFSEKT